jgi:hypothetical protein
VEVGDDALFRDIVVNPIPINGHADILGRRSKLIAIQGGFGV